MTDRQLHFIVNIAQIEGVRSGWHRGETEADAIFRLEHFRRLARIAERGKLDAVFLGDRPSLTGDQSRTPLGRLDPLVLQSALAGSTERIGHIVTASTSYNHPYNLARRIGSLDLISGGRAIWNAVTTRDPASARNFGLDDAPLHSERYGRADEFLEVVTKLWASWDEGAIVGDRASGRWADNERIRPIGHRGRYFDVEGPLNVPRSPQGRPLIIQAGGSDQGRNFAARWADIVFTAQTTLEEGRQFYADIRRRVEAQGRRPDSIRILAGLSTIVGSTEEETRRLADELFETEGTDAQLAALSAHFSQDLHAYDLDQPLPKELLVSRTGDQPGSHGFYQAQINLAIDGDLTLRQLLRSQRAGHRLIVGTPEQVADSIETWFQERAADGFNFLPDPYLSGFEILVDEVLPILRRRGLFRDDYTGSTARDHFGLN